MALTWTDWRGHDYTVGDTILYARMSGRSCEMAEGIVEDLAVYYKDDRYRWTRLKDGEAVPEKPGFKYRNPETQELTGRFFYSDDPRSKWERVPVMIPVEHERRAKIVPTKRTSRWTRSWSNDKAVTLRVTESITAIKP